MTTNPDSYDAEISNDLSDAERFDELTDRLQTITAIGDMLGSCRLDELADDTVTNLGVLLFRTASEAHCLADEMWNRLNAEKGNAAVVSSGGGVAVTGTNPRGPVDEA